MTAGLNLRERQKLQVRADILVSASALLIERGFLRMSIDDLVGAAGISRSTFYNHFVSKDAVLEALVADNIAEWQQFFTLFGQLPDWGKDTILGWVRQIAASWSAHVDQYRAVLMAAPSGFLFTADSAAVHRGDINAVRSNSILWRHFDTTTANLRASMVIAITSGEFARLFLADRFVELDAFVEQLTVAIRVLLEADRHTESPRGLMSARPPTSSTRRPL